jgi:Lon-like protease
VRQTLAVLVAFAVSASGLVAIALVVVALLFFLPLPVLVFGPGAAVDLNTVVDVPGHTPPPGKLYLTDITVMPGRPAFYVVGKLLPGYEVVNRAEYAGNINDLQFERELADAMKDSQTVAQLVAERAAGLPVKVDLETQVVSVNPKLPGARCLRANDVIASIEGVKPTSNETLPRVTASKPVGSLFHLVVSRGNHRLQVVCRTAMFRGKPRFGIIISTRAKALALPVKVAFSVKDINGSSAGLMFALQIYRTLTGKPLAGGKDIAGTGVLAVDGTVLPVGGAKEKLAAALQKHAQIFLVPASDYAKIKDVRGVTIFPVSSFGDALKKLETVKSTG